MKVERDEILILTRSKFTMQITKGFTLFINNLINNNEKKNLFTDCSAGYD